MCGMMWFLGAVTDTKSVPGWILFGHEIQEGSTKVGRGPDSRGVRVPHMWSGVGGNLGVDWVVLWINCPRYIPTTIGRLREAMWEWNMAFSCGAQVA